MKKSMRKFVALTLTGGTLFIGLGGCSGPLLQFIGGELLRAATSTIQHNHSSNNTTTTTNTTGTTP